MTRAGAPPNDILVARVARLAFSSSSMRGKGNRGVVEVARAFARGLDLAPFGTRDGAAFLQALDSATDTLVSELPRSARKWGLARKGLNIFLRECLYLRYTCDAFSLHRAERWFELPLDSITAGELRELDPDLPRWPGVRELRPSESAAYQAAASAEARNRGFARVHLDAEWWGAREAEGR